MSKHFTVLCLAVALSLPGMGTTSADTITSPEAAWTIDVTSVGSSTNIQLTADSSALLQGESLNPIYRTWGDPSNSNTWIPLSDGGYLKSLTMGLLAEPVISLNFSVTAGSVNRTFTITSAWLSFPTKHFAEGTASAGITVTDEDQVGATLTGLYSGSKAYEATYNGTTTFANLVSPIDATLSGSNTENVLSWQPMETLSSMQSSFAFTLSAGDAADGTSIYTTRAVVPEPSTIALLGMGVIGLLGYACRRHKTT